MADSQDPDARQLAANTINTARNLHDTRHSVFAAKLARLHFGHDGHDAPDEHSASAPQSIIPNALLEHISKADDVDDAVKESAARSLTLSQKIRDDRQAVLGAKEAAVKAEIFHRGVYDMQHRGDGDDSRTFRYLPGKVIRVEGQPLVKDKNVNEAYDNCLKVLEFYKKVFDYNSLDNKNMPVISSVHFAQNYGNAFWFDSKKQMVYGDGDKFLYNFTGCIDVIGHEMTVSLSNEAIAITVVVLLCSLYSFILELRIIFISVFIIMFQLISSISKAEHSSQSIPFASEYSDLPISRFSLILLRQTKGSNS